MRLRFENGDDWAGALEELMPKDYSFEDDSIDDPVLVLKIVALIHQAPEVRTKTCTTSGQVHIMARWKDENGVLDDIADLFLDSEDRESPAICNFFTGSDRPGESGYIFGETPLVETSALHS